jgi:hypothetical protein
MNEIVLTDCQLLAGTKLQVRQGGSPGPSRRKKTVRGR